MPSKRSTNLPSSFDHPAPPIPLRPLQGASACGRVAPLEPAAVKSRPPVLQRAHPIPSRFHPRPPPPTAARRGRPPPFLRVFSYSGLNTTVSPPQKSRKTQSRRAFFLWKKRNWVSFLELCREAGGSVRRMRAAKTKPDGPFRDAGRPEKAFSRSGLLLNPVSPAAPALPAPRAAPPARARAPPPLPLRPERTRPEHHPLHPPFIRVQIHLGRLDRRMPHVDLDRPDVPSSRKQMRRDRVPQDMRRHPSPTRLDPRLFPPTTEDQIHRRPRQRPLPLGRKQPR